MKKICISLMTCILVLTGCSTAEKENTAMQNGTLTGIAFDYQNGMLYGTDYAFSITEEEIESAWFFDDGEEFAESHIKITREQWNEISGMTRDLLTFLKPGFKSKTNKHDIVLDGGSESFSLQWLNEQGETVTVQYSFPWEERFHDLQEYLKEIVHPLNRELTYAEEPVLNGLILGSKGSLFGLKDYEFSIRTTNGGTSWKLINSRDEKKEIILSAEQWKTVFDFISAFELQYLPFSDSNRNYVTLYYQSGNRKNVVPSDEVFAQIEAYIEDMLRQSGR